MQATLILKIRYCDAQITVVATHWQLLHARHEHGGTPNGRWSNIMSTMMQVNSVIEFAAQWPRAFMRARLNKDSILIAPLQEFRGQPN